MSPPSAELAMLELFRQCLGRADVSLGDDFFALGGDSLQASRILTRAQELFGIELPPDALFRHPTPRALAGLLRQPDAPAPQVSSSLVTLHAGDGLPIYLIHPTSGNPWVFRALVGRAGFARPVIGTRAPDLDWERDVMTLEELALHYAGEIRSRQRHGPYSLAGYSFGGNLAFEIASRLARDGQEVRHLVMLDADGPHSAWSRLCAREQNLNTLRRLLCRMGRFGAAALDVAGFTAPMRRAFLCFEAGPLEDRELRRILSVAFGRGAPVPPATASTRELCEAIVARFKPVLDSPAWEYLARRAPGDDPLVLVKAHKVWAKNEHLARHHRPSRAFHGTMTIFACAGNRAVLRWRRYTTRPLELRWLDVAPEEHTSLLEEQHVGAYADAFRRVFEGERETGAGVDG
jgi:thioesterase domain-containing protein/acyl carrier protein